MVDEHRRDATSGARATRIRDTGAGHVTQQPPPPSTQSLLNGSRGRRLCLEYARAVSSDVHQVIFWLNYRAAPSSSFVLIHADGADAVEEPNYSPADLVALLESIDVEHPHEDAVWAALRASVDSARYWQEPDNEDMVAALPEVRTALSAIAAMILRSTRASTWERERSTEQWAVDWHAPTDAAPLPSNMSSHLSDWNRAQQEEELRAETDRPQDPHTNWSGTWWSVPQRVLTTRGDVDTALDLVEDSLGWEVATVVPVRGAVRGLEIRSADDWAQLCRTYPFEVTASRRHDWFRVTGRDSGRWLIPDWLRVSQDWDAVHLSTFAYLRAAETLIEIDDEYASVIGGWGPDSTLWLTDSARERDQPRQHWVRDPDSGEWVRPRESS